MMGCGQMMVVYADDGVWADGGMLMMGCGRMVVY